MINSKLYQSLPKSPGVYLFKDNRRSVLYVGKAINIRNRVKSHFTDKTDDLRHQNLIFLAKKVDFQTVSGELEALLLEARLIKQYRPKYNALLKDDKRYLYVGISKEKYPRIYLLRKPEIEENLAFWFGPYPTSAAIKEILRFLRRIFPYRTCRAPTVARRAKGCLYYHLHLCPAPCINEVQNYSQTIKKIRLFLNGEIKPLVSLLTKQMNEASKSLKFEEAQVAKRQITMLQNLLSRRPKSADEEKTDKQLGQLKDLLIRYQGFDPFIIHRVEAFDISNLGKEITVGSMVAFVNAEPDTSLYRQFRLTLRSPEGAKGEKFGINDTAGIKQIISRRLSHQEWVFPQVILVDGGKGQVSAAFEALKEKNLAGKIGLLGLTKAKPHKQNFDINYAPRWGERPVPEDQNFSIQAHGPLGTGKFETIIIPRIEKDKIISWKLLPLLAPTEARQGEGGSPSSPVLQLLQHIRDESHRFAQRYYKVLAIPPELKSFRSQVKRGEGGS